MLDKIKEHSEDGLVVCPVGVGSAFATKNFNSSFIIAYNRKTLLFDIGQTVPYALSQKGIKITDFDSYYVSHAHSDHIGGMEQLLFTSRYVTKTKPNFISFPSVMKDLWNKTLSGGLEEAELPNLTLEDYLTITPLTYDESVVDLPTSDEPVRARVLWENCNLRFLENLHVPSNVNNYDNVMSTTGLSVDTLHDGGVFISGDTRFTPRLLELASEYDTIFHDCQLFDAPEDKLVHATYNQLKELPDELRQKMYLYHYGDNFTDFHPEDDGFAGFAKPWEIYII